jgi:hypothetical protein
MWHGFIGQRIAATTRTLHRLGMLLFLAALALGIYGSRTFLNVIKGPALMDEAKLETITNPNLELRNYVTVEGKKTVSSGITSIEKTTRNGTVESQRTTGEFMLMLVGKHILIVKAKPGMTRESYSGGLSPIPDDVKKEVFANLEEPDLQAAIFPLVLDATGDYGDDLVLGYVVIGGLVLGGLWALIQSKRRSEMPERHPLCKALSQYGPLYSIVPEIDAEFCAANSTFASTTFTQNWVIACWLTHSHVMRRDEIIWAYKKRTRHSVNFIPTGTSHAVILRDTRGKLLELSGTELYVNGFLSGFAEQTPWIIFGYDKKIEKLYRKERQNFVRVVAERKAELTGVRN